MKKVFFVLGVLYSMSTSFLTHAGEYNITVDNDLLQLDWTPH